MVTPEQLSGLIHKIYDAALDPRQWTQVMDAARRLIGVEHSVFMMIDSQRPQSSIINYDGFDPHYADEILERREAEDYYYLAIKQQPKNRVMLGTDLISLSEMHRRPFYHEISRKVQCEWLVGGVIENSPDRHGCITFLRNKESGSFSSQDKQFIAMLLPHIQKACFLQGQLAQRDSYKEALQQSPYGVLVLDASRKVLFRNRKAEHYIREQDGLSFRNGQLKLRHYEDQIRLDQSVKQALSSVDALGTNAQRLLTAIRPSGMLPYQIEVHPLNTRSEVATLMENASCLIFIHDPAHPISLSAVKLRNAYGLTGAEARLCLHLFEGQTLQDTAERLGISRNTAKTHLKHVFAKCKVSSQPQLMRLLAHGFLT